MKSLSSFLPLGYFHSAVCLHHQLFPLVLNIAGLWTSRRYIIGTRENPIVLLFNSQTGTIRIYGAVFQKYVTLISTVVWATWCFNKYIILPYIQWNAGENENLFCSPLKKVYLNKSSRSSRSSQPLLLHKQKATGSIPGSDQEVYSWWFYSVVPTTSRQNSNGTAAMKESFGKDSMWKITKEIQVIECPI